MERETAGRPPQLVSTEPVSPAAPVAAANFNNSRRVIRFGGMAESIVPRNLDADSTQPTTETDKDLSPDTFAVSNHDNVSELDRCS